MTTCETCRWWGGRISGRLYDPGPCRRYPPTVWANLKGPNANVRPIMGPNDWCGEHQPQEAQGDD